MTTRDGTSIATLTAGSRTDALFVHANGFCKELWLPVIEGIGRRLPAFGWAAIDLRGQGESDRSEPPYEWPRAANDVADVSSDRGPFRTGVGHSIGGALVARVEAENPGTFERLVLIEPIILPPPYERTDIPLARMADARRGSFESREMARERFANGPFSSWTPEAIDLYLDHGFAETSEGFTLRCAPAVEADYFREGNNHDTWDRVATIEAPVVILYGARSEWGSADGVHAIASRFPLADVSIVEIPDADHLGPMTHPESYAEPIARFLTG